MRSVHTTDLSNCKAARDCTQPVVGPQVRQLGGCRLCRLPELSMIPLHPQSMFCSAVAPRLANPLLPIPASTVVQATQASSSWAVSLLGYLQPCRPALKTPATATEAGALGGVAARQEPVGHTLTPHGLDVASRSPVEQSWCIWELTVYRKYTWDSYSACTRR